MTILVGNNSGLGGSGGGGGSGMPVAPTTSTYAAKGSSWSNVMSLLGTQTYVWSTDITSTDPLAGGVKGNNAVALNVTEIYISNTSSQTTDFTSMLRLFDEQDYLLLADFENNNSFALVRATGKAVDNGTWFTLPVQVESTSGSLFASGINTSVTLIPMAGRSPTVESMVIVTSLDDLPAPSLGIIDLLPDKQYIQVADINFGTTQVRFGQTRYSGLGTNVITATYTGTGALFLCTGESTINDITMDTPNGSPLDWNTTGGLIMRWEDCTVENCTTAASFTANGGAVRMTNITYRNIITNGHVLTGSFVSFNYESAGIFITLGDIFDITAATFTVFFNLRNLVVAQFPAGTVFIRGLANDANLGASCVASVTNSRLLGAGTPLVGVSISDIRWDFLGVTPLSNSTKASDVYLTATQTVTIAVADTWVPIGGVLWASDVLERFTSTTAGVLTYIGRDASNFLSVSNSTLEKVGGGSNRIGTAISINGVLTGAQFIKTTSSTQNATPTNVTSTLLASLSTGDTLQMYVKNLDGTSNIIIDSCSLSVINGF